MQLALYMRLHMTLKLDSGMQMVHTHLVVLCKCTSIVSGGLCATVGSPHLLLTLHAASLDTPARIDMKL